MSTNQAVVVAVRAINVSINDSVTSTAVIMGNRVRRSMSSSESIRREVTVQMCYSAKTVPDPYSGDWKCSVAIGYGEQTVHETKRNADAFETPTLLND